jgi:hypothetical protein
MKEESRYKKGFQITGLSKGLAPGSQNKTAEAGGLPHQLGIVHARALKQHPGWGACMTTQRWVSPGLTREWADRQQVHETATSPNTPP